MKIFKINLTNVPSDEDPKVVEAVKAAVEEIYNRGANAGFFMGFGVAIAFIGGGLIAHEVCKRIDKMSEIRNQE